jgi:hypothetical protein
MSPETERGYVMRKIILIMIFANALLFNFAASHGAEIANPLKAGMPNTVTLSNGDVVYDLNGDWDAIYDNKQFGGKNKDVVKITQEGNKFVGIKLIGNQWVGKGKETIRGELEGDGFKSFNTFTVAYGWTSSNGKISGGGNKIATEFPMEAYGTTYIFVLVLTRK